MLRDKVWLLISRRKGAAKVLSTDLAYDTFTRADGVLGSTELVGSDGLPCTARAWVVALGIIEVVSQQCKCTALGPTHGIATINPLVRSVSVSAEVTLSFPSIAGVIGSYVDGNNFILAYTDGGHAILYKFIGGVGSALDVAAIVYGNGKVLKLIINGTTVSMNYDGLDVGIPQTVSDAGLLSGTRAGVWLTNGVNTIYDNFKVVLT